MPVNKILRRAFLLTTACLLFSAALAHAETPPRLSAQHLTDGERFYQKGKDLKAADRFVRALLLDVGNKDARQRLCDVLKDSTALTQKQRLQLQRFVDLVDYHNFLIGQAESLMSRSRQSIETIKRASSSKETSSQLAAAADRLEELKREMVNSRQLMPAEGIPKSLVLDVLFTRLQAGIEQLEHLRSELTDWQGRLRQKQFAMLKSTQGQPSPLDAGQRPEKISTSATLQMTGEDFRNELKTMQFEFQVLQDKLKETDQRVTVLTKNLAEMSLEAFEKEKVIADKDAQMAKLEGDLQETAQKLNLVQRIIQEKDRQIQILQTDIRNLQTSVAGKVPPDAGSGGNAPSSDGLARLPALEGQLKELNDKYGFLVQKIQEKDQMIEQLRKTISEKDEDLGAIQQASQDRASELSILSGILQIYRERLGDTYSTLQQKEEELDRLEKQIQSSDASLKDSSQMANRNSSTLTGNSGIMDDFRDKNAILFDDVRWMTPEQILKETKENIEYLHK